MGLAATLLLVLPAGAETAWPTIVFPQEVSEYSVGEQMVVNGLPMRIRGFVSSAAPAKVLELFRKSMGKPLNETSLGNKLILGRPQGEHYLAVQLEPMGSGTRGLFAVSHMKAAASARSDTRAAAERWLARLPSGSRLISQLESNDNGRLDRHLVASNTYHEDVNRDRTIAMMREDGLVLEREANPGEEALRSLPAGAGNGRTLFFKGAGKEAIATISRDQAGRTVLVLNAITDLERFK